MPPDSTRDDAISTPALNTQAEPPTGAAPALMAAALAQLGEGVILTDAAGRIAFVNDAAARLHGMARLDVEPSQYADTYHLLTEDGQPYPSAELPLARAVLRGETVVDARWRIRRPDGSVVLVVGSARPVLAHDGRRAGAVLTLRDDSASEAAEEAAAQLAEQALELELTNQQLQDNAVEIEAARSRVAFLADASERLASSLDNSTTISEVVALAVPAVSEWAAYSVYAGDGTIRMVDVYHPDPEKEAQARERARRYPIRVDGPSGVALVLRTGEPELLTDVPDSVLRAVAHDAEHLAMLRDIGLRSVMTVPVIAQGQTLGALSFGTGESGRSFGEDDLSFALELARRAATAIERTRLYAETVAARRDAEAAATRTMRLQRLTARLNEARSATQIADAVFEGGLEAVGADAGSLAIVHADESGAPVSFELVRAAGFRAEIAERYRRFPFVPGRPLSDAVQHRALTLVGSSEEWARRYPNAPEDLAAMGFSAFAAIPVVVADRVIAAITFSFHAPQLFDDAMRAFLTTFGEQCALALARQRAHEAQLQEAAEHAALLETIQDPLVAFDRDVRYTYVNAHAEALLGFSASELIGRRLEEVFPATADSPFATAVRRALDSGRSERVEAFAPQVQAWIDARIYPAPGGVSVVIQDVTERRRAQDAATFMVEASRLLSGSLDYEATLRSLARAAVPVLGDWCTVDMLADPYSTAWPPEVQRIAVMHQDPAKVEWAAELERLLPQDWSAPTGLPRVLREGTTEFFPVVSDEMLVAAAKSPEQLAILREIDFHAYLCVPLVARGRTLGALTLIMTESGRRYDETDRALAEDLAQRAATAVENARLYRDAERAREAAEAANRAKSEFLSTMSHELRTPLNAIAGYTQLMTMGIRGAVTDPQRQDLARIERASQHLMALVTDVLNFARLDAGQIEFNLADVDLATVIGDLEPLLGPQLSAKGLAFDHDGCASDTPDQPHLVRADPEKLRQILLNLLTNAVKFTDAGGRVTLACETDALAGVVRIRVADTGRGIAPDQLERIFEPFVQVDRHRTHESQQGVGLGLAISRDLARGMGGELAVESEPGVGSTFTLTLPTAGGAGG